MATAEIYNMADIQLQIIQSASTEYFGFLCKQKKWRWYSLQSKIVLKSTGHEKTHDNDQFSKCPFP